MSALAEVPTPSAGRDGARQEALEALRRLPMFQALSESELGKIAAVAELEHHEQDRVVPRGGDGAAPPGYCFLVRGQIAFAEFERGKVPPPPVNKKKRITPTMQVAKRVVALFDTGDFFTNEHAAYARGEDGEKVDMALFTCVNVVLLVIPKDRLDAIVAAVPAVQEAIEVKAEEAYYRQTLLKLDERADLLDVYVKQGFEYAKAIKVIQTDKCIDCDECVKACEDRHGIARIERFGPRVGLIQFTLNCRTCEDARCIAACNFDAIGYDEDQEVIVYDNCVGCTKCAKDCPHEAIRMVDIQNAVPNEAIDIVALAKEGKDQPDKPLTKVAKGEEKKAKKKKPKRIANKCDHCFGFSDMACISACPTGAIIQIDPRALFRRDGGYFDRADRYFEPAPFEHGWAATTRTQGVWGMLTLFAIATLGVLAAVWEVLARKVDPSMSLWRFAVEWLDGPLAAAALQLSYTPVSGLGRWLGYIGGAMMTISALYTLRLHIPGLKRIGNSKTWFDFHVVFGLAGPVLSTLHTDFNIFSPMERPLVTTLWWCVTFIVVSGIVGRFIYTAIPKLEASTQRERKKLDDGIQQVADQWASMTMSANVLAQFLKAQEKADEAPPAAEGSAWSFMWFLIQSEVSRWRGEWALRTKTMGQMQNRKLRRTTLRLMSRRSVIERRMQFFDVAKRLLAQWRGIHIGISIVMFVLLVAHIAISVYAVGW